jgi:ribosomal protein L22
MDRGKCHTETFTTEPDRVFAENSANIFYKLYKLIQQKKFQQKKFQQKKFSAKKVFSKKLFSKKNNAANNYAVFKNRLL